MTCLKCGLLLAWSESGFKLRILGVISMNKETTLVILLINSTFSIAFGTVGQDLKSEKAEIYKIKQLVCASGTLDETKATQLMSQNSNSWFIADTESRGGVLQKSGEILAEVIKINGNPNGICNNNGTPTLLIKIHEKIIQ
jgi:hypothetical protein